MKIVFMGTPDFAAGTFAALVEGGYEIVCAVTQPDRPRGRKKEPAPSPVKEEALKRDIPVFQPEKIRNPEAVEEIRKISPDMIVVSAFGQIIPKAILDIPPFGCINVHASLLPAYRGAAPIQHAILDGLSETGVTVMRMDEGLDTGDIIAQRAVPIRADETGGSLFEKLAREGAQLLLETIPSIESGTASYTPQPKESTTAYAGMLKKETGCIDWTESALQIERRIRALNPWPSAYTRMDKKTLKVWAARPEKPGMTGKAGMIVRQDHKGIYVQTGDGILCLTEVQMEGKKRMAVPEFLRGYIIRDNDLNHA